MDVPEEIRQAEAKTPAASGRGVRFTAFAGLGALAVATGVVYLGAVVGIDAVEDLADVLVPFDNLYLGLALDGGVIATCVWLWRQEVATRDENVQRIWAEVQRRRAEPPSKASKKKQAQVGFAKGRKASRPSAAPAAGAGGFGSSSALQAPLKPAAAPPPAAPPPPAREGGLKKVWGELYEQADAAGRAQALTLNAALEERGVLPKLQTAEDGAATKAVPRDDAAVSAPPAAAPVATAEGEDGVAGNVANRAPERSRSAKKSKGKRKKRR